MRFTHLDIVTVLGGVLALVIFMLGYWRGHYRAYAECCDCCTCQDCGGGSDDTPVFDYDLTVERRDTGELVWERPRRHAVVLEPGPTIYPALAELAGEVMDGPHSDSEPIDSTWLRLLMLDWDRRYPIPQEVR